MGRGFCFAQWGPPSSNRGRSVGPSFLDKVIPCYAIVLPGRKSALRAGFRVDSTREILKIGCPAGRRPAVGPILMFSRVESFQNPARKFDFRPGGTVE